MLSSNVSVISSKKEAVFIYIYNMKELQTRYFRDQEEFL